MHATLGQVHHAVVARDFLYHIAVDCRRTEMTEAIGGLMDCWSASVLESEEGRQVFDEHLEYIAAHLGVAPVIRLLPPGIRRITTVAGGVLADIPLAALPVPEGRLGLRFALCDLPCLSVRPMLDRRSARLRGGRGLLVDPFGEIDPDRGRWHKVLPGKLATPEGLAAELRRERYRQVWIHCHGQSHVDDSAQVWLELSPGESDGRLRPAELQEMDLNACGTLILGSCESGMAQRVGRDERIGFVRAGLRAGVPSVVAARWVAAAPVAVATLSRFRFHLRYLPRDLALRQAQRELCDGTIRTLTDVADVAHPARWACWSLYGDPGWQSRSGPFRWLTRRTFHHLRSS
jgi:hypothetical protein